MLVATVRRTCFSGGLPAFARQSAVMRFGLLFEHDPENRWTFFRIMLFDQ
jgi:hypothetical protein